MKVIDSTKKSKFKKTVVNQASKLRNGLINNNNSRGGHSVLAGGLFRPKVLSTIIAMATAGVLNPSYAQNNADELEEVLVTGSYIRSTPGDEPVPVQVMNRDDLDAIGATTVADIIGKLAISSGSENQADSLTQGATQGTSNVNLRGLGLSSTLVLINGRRQTISGSLPNDGSVFVDTSTIPANALERVEILKEGAASTYGSDAIAGVVNFILRKDFEGLEINTGFQSTTNDSQKDTDAGFLWGSSLGENTHIMVSGNFLDRTPLSAADRPNLNDNAISSLGTTFLPLAAVTVASGDYAGTYARLENVPQANCLANEGGVLIPQASGSRCGFHYGPRFNSVNSEHRRQLYTNISHEFDGGTQLLAELGWSNNNVEDNFQSPSYPYLAFPKIAASHPSNPFGVPVVWLGRPLSAGYESPTAARENDTFRASFSANGSLESGLNWDVALTYSQNEYTIFQPDTLQSRLDSALAGDGLNDGTEIAGRAPTGIYFDPFVPSNNSQELVDWISFMTETQRTTDLLVLDGVVSGDLFEMSGGTAAFAAGIQVREEGYEVETDDVHEIKFDAGGNPIPIDLIFRGGVSEVKTDRRGYAVFAESKFPIADSFEITAALRYEKLDSDDTIDPKLAMRWEISDQLILRASASTAFREPSLSQLNATSVSLQGIQDFNADGSTKAGVSFVRVASQGAANLAPEESTNYNIGAIVRPTEDLEFKLDYWQVDYTDLVTQESAQGLIQADINGPNIVRTSGGTLIGVNTNYFNSSSVEVDGIDIEAHWDITDSWFIKANVSHFLNYDLALANGSTVEAAGYFNHDNFARSLPETKGNTMLTWTGETQNASLILNYVSSYETTRAVPATESQNIDSYITVDAQYSNQLPLSFGDDSTATLTFGIKNLFDEEPPRVYDAANLSYDPKQASPLGRIWYAKAKFRF